MFDRSNKYISLIALILSNLFVIAGAIIWDWSIYYIVLLYWAETVIIGLFNILKILWFKKKPEPETPVEKVIMFIARIFVMPLFSIPYFIFTAMSLAFILLLFVLNDFSQLETIVKDTIELTPDSLVYGLLALVGSHLFSFLYHYLYKREFEKVTWRYLLFSPFQRIVVMQVTVVIAGFIIFKTNEPHAILIVFVVVKSIVDAFAHLRQHRKVNTLSK